MVEDKAVKAAYQRSKVGDLRISLTLKLSCSKHDENDFFLPIVQTAQFLKRALGHFMWNEEASRLTTLDFFHTLGQYVIGLNIY